MYVFKRGDEINTRNGWRFVVSRVDGWKDADGTPNGAVYGAEVGKGGKRSASRYLGTVRGLRDADDYYINS